MIIDGGTFFSNIAEDDGGALSARYSDFNLINTIFRSNKAGSSGGAIYSYNTDNDSTIVNSIFDSNSSKRGGAIYNYEASAVGINLTFANNQAESGAAVYSQGSSSHPTYANSIFWSNQATNDSTSTSIVNNNADTFVSHSIVEGGYIGEEIIDEDPQFANSESGDFRLRSNSPAINIGYSNFVAEETDIIGNTRIINAEVDLGAYEYFANQVPSDTDKIESNNNSVKHGSEENNEGLNVEEETENTSNSSQNSIDAEVNLQDRYELSDIHRFYQTQKGFHLYTSDINEIDYIKTQSARGDLNYSYEAEKYTVLNSDRDISTGEVIEDVLPVYRFFNTETGAHLYTMNEVEKNTILENLPNYAFEDIKYYAFESEPENIETLPVYRMLNSNTGAHLFTVDQNEVNYIQANLPNFSLEGNNGVAFYVFALD